MLLLTLVGMAGTTYLEVLIPVLIKESVDIALMTQSHFEQLVSICLQILGVTLVLGVFMFFRRYFATFFSQRIAFMIRNDLFLSLQKQSYSFYDNTMTGQLMSRATTDIRRIRWFFGGHLIRSFRFIFLLVGVVLSMLTMDWQLTAISFTLYPVTFVAYYVFVKTIRPIYNRMREQYGVLTSVLAENIVNIRIVQAFTRENYEIQKFSKESSKYLDESLQAVRVRTNYLPFIAFLTQIGTIAILWYGGQQVIDGALSFGAFIAFNLYLSMLLMPARFFGGFISGYQRAMAAGTRVFEIINRRPDVEDKPGGIELSGIRGHVKFENVSFSYDGSNLVLKDINLEAEPGETIAVLGHTGSGKSSIIQLIPRFYNVTTGKITIDGYDIRDIRTRSLRRNIGVVAQDSFLFSRTIRENIAFGKPDATEEEIVKAAKTAQAHEFISALPQGYDARVGERGVTLSGGQQQRIAIARMLVTDPKILIMDDPTSSVDVDTEFEIQQALQQLLSNRTTFIITQRVSTIRNADQIIVLQDGKIAERGNHESLMTKQGIYFNIYQTLYEAQKTRREGKEE
ncbi:MAG: ABC transporter ATP-binding protein [Candidatus Bathyarchaeota archaeon]|nr:MAG: ABC transporter ATP-binding protein [Candidatus Bathyarchaeota archaeon]